MKELTSHILISSENSEQFAKLSADYNPMHTDDNYARRLQFGGTVIHGIHTCLKLLDDVLSSKLGVIVTHLNTLVVTFQSPVRTGSKIDYVAKFDEEKNILKVIAYSKGRRALSLKISFLSSQLPVDTVDFIEQNNIELTPENTVFPPKVGQPIELPLIYDQALAMKLFPSLVRDGSNLQIAQLLATTYIVGMKCPGLNSIFSGLKLDYSNENSDVNSTSVVYVVDKADDRFNQVKISVRGEKFNGTIEAFFRPQPIVQPDYLDIQNIVKNRVFKNVKTLVVGGSRGLGEVTAKILAAAGADVAITYFRGYDDAVRVCEDIQSGGGKCRHYNFDVTQSAAGLGQVNLNDWQPEHIYYFATPLIEMNNSDAWDGALFRHFCNYYVDGLAHSLNIFGFNNKSSVNPKYIFYPSTIYVTESTKGFLEYATAKATGEAFCELTQQIHDNLLFFCPRLQRLKTDQTNAVTIVDTGDPVTVLYQYLNEFQQKIDEVRREG